MKPTPKDTLKKAIEAHKLGRLQEADRIYTSLLQAVHEYSDANHSAGSLAADIGKAEDVVPFFEGELEADPEAAKYWASYIDVLIKLGKISEARDFLKVVKVKGTKEDVFDSLKRRLASVTYREPSQYQLQPIVELYNRGQFERVLELTGELQNQFPQSVNIYNLQGASNAAILYNKGQFERVLELTGELQNQFPQSVNIHNLQGASNAALNRTEEAAQSFRRAMEISPNDANIHNNMGNVLIQLGTYQEAIASYQKAIELSPKFIEAHDNLGNALNNLGKYQEAIVAYKKVIELRPEYAETYTTIGSALIALGQNEKAIPNFNKAVILNPDNARAYNNLANVLHWVGSTRRALKCFRIAEKIAPHSSDIYYNQGVAFYDAKKYKAAAESYIKALILNPGSLDVYSNLGDAKFGTGDEEEFRRFFSISLCVNPEKKYVKHRLLECLYISKKYQTLQEQVLEFAHADKLDRGVAAVSSFVADQLDIDDVYPFCPAPLEFVYRGNLNKYIDNSDRFLREVIEEAIAKTLIYENRSTKFGYQTTGNIFMDPTPNIAELQKILEQEIDKYYAMYGNNSCEFMTKWPTQKKIGGWFVKLEQHGYQLAHIHPTGWLSGVAYLQMPEATLGAEGGIEFGLHGFDMPLLKNDYPRLILKPKNGDIVLFPSSLFHRTIPFTTKTERCVIAFDLIPHS